MIQAITICMENKNETEKYFGSLKRDKQYMLFVGVIKWRSLMRLWFNATLNCLYNYDSCSFHRLAEYFPFFERTCMSLTSWSSSSVLCHAHNYFVRNGNHHKIVLRCNNIYYLWFRIYVLCYERIYRLFSSIIQPHVLCRYATAVRTLCWV